MLQKEKDLRYLLHLRDSKGQEGKREWMVSIFRSPVHHCQSISQSKLLEEGFDDDAGLDETIKKLENDLKKARKREADGEEPIAS